MMNRLLSTAEQQLIRWMLEHGAPEAREFLVQVESLMVSPWQCECGCASLELVAPGRPQPSGGLRVLADFVFGGDDDLSGILLFAQDGVLSGLEVYRLAGEAPRRLPLPEALRPFETDGA